MKRFYFNEPPDDSDDEFNIYDEEAEMSDEELGTAYAFIDQGDIVNAMHLDIAEQELDQELLEKATKIAKQSWFWLFKSNVKKIAEIEFIFNHLKRIIGREEPELELELENEEE